MDHTNFKTLFNRNHNTLKAEIKVYHNESKKRYQESLANPAGNLCMHLVGDFNASASAALVKTDCISI